MELRLSSPALLILFAAKANDEPLRTRSQPLLSAECASSKVVSTSPSMACCAGRGTSGAPSRLSRSSATSLSPVPPHTVHASSTLCAHEARATASHLAASACSLTKASKLPPTPGPRPPPSRPSPSPPSLPLPSSPSPLSPLPSPRPPPALPPPCGERSLLLTVASASPAVCATASRRAAGLRIPPRLSSCRRQKETAISWISSRVRRRLRSRTPYGAR
eukprot:scaffold3955_cov35-Phaeocystis_antarctica.AAC.2